MAAMMKPYGKRPKTSKAAPPSAAPESTAFKIRLRGKDNAPLTIPDLNQGLYEAMRRLSRYGGYRAKWATLYLTLVDENGQEVRINEEGEWTIFPYQSAADEHDA